MGEMFPRVEVIPGRGKGSADYRHHTAMGLADYRRAGNSEGYPPEWTVMLQKYRAIGLLSPKCGRRRGVQGEKRPPLLLP